MIRDAGFGATALWWGEDSDRARELRAIVPDLVRNAGLFIDNIHVPYQGCNELWVTDGTPAGTQLLKNIHEGLPPNATNSDPDLFTVVGEPTTNTALGFTKGTITMRP